MLKKAILLFPILCMLVIMVSCGGNPIIPQDEEESSIRITDMFWHPNTKIIEITLDPFSSTWGDWTMYINGEKIPMEGGPGNPVIRPNASLDESPTGLLVGTLPWVSPLTEVDFPCCGTLQFNIPGEGFTNEYEFNLINFGCETASEEECSQTPIPEPESSDDFILIQVKDPESNIIFIAGEKNEATVTILGEKNNQGEPIKITGTLYISKQGDGVFLEAGIDGLPTYIIDSEGNKITFENYSNSTVDIALYDSNENLIEGPITIDVNPQDLLEIKQLYDSSHLKQKYMPWWSNFIDIQFDWALDALAFANNGVGMIYENGDLVGYTKPWEREINFFDLLTEDNFIIIYEATFLSTIVDDLSDLSDYMSSILDIIAEANEYIDSVNSENHPPTISSLTANPSSVDISQSTTITCTASDQDGDTLTYNWTKTGGTITGSGSTVTWTAPSTVGTYTITCTVSDGELFDTQSFTINVDNDGPPNLPAPANVLASQGTMDMVQIAWSIVTGATHYRVYRATSETGTKTAIEGWGWITNNYAVDFLGITQGVHYFYFVKAATDSIGSNASDYSEYAEGWTTGSYDVIPTIYDPGSSVNSGTPYTVSWSDESADGAEKYNLFEIESTATSGTLYTVYGTSKEFTHNVDKDTTYYYKVRAYSDGAWSSYSDQVDMVVKEVSCVFWTASQSGDGAGQKIDNWDISDVVTGSKINFYFDAMSIPDRWYIVYNGVVVCWTGWRGDASYVGDPLYPEGVISPGDGQVLAVITKLAGVDTLTVSTDSRDPDTAWDYRLETACK